MENKIINDEENKLLKFIIKLKEYKLNLSTISENQKDTENIDENYDILLNYIKDQNSIKNKTEKFFKAIESLAEINGEMIISFLPNLNKIISREYLRSELCTKEDSDKNIFKYQNLFNIIKYNIYLTKDIIEPIYDYFTHLYLNSSDLLENNSELCKLNNVYNLWKILYTFKNDSQIQIQSSFNFIGTGIILKVKEIDNNLKYLENNDFSIFISIELTGKNFLGSYDNNSAIIKFGNKISINYIDIKEKINKEINKGKKLKYINFEFGKQKGLEIEVIFIGKNPEKDIVEKKVIKNKEIFSMVDYSNKIYSEDIIILENFIGSIKEINIKFSMGKLTSINKCLPYYIKNDKNEISLLKPRGEVESDKKNSQLLKFEKNINIELSFQNKNLCKINYTNYFDSQYKLIKFFEGIDTFLPFIGLIKLLYNNKVITKINNEEKNKYLINFLDGIIYQIANILNSAHVHKYKELFEEVSEFFVYFLLYSIEFILDTKQLYTPKSAPETKEEIKKCFKNAKDKYDIIKLYDSMFLLNRDSKNKFIYFSSYENFTKKTLEQYYRKTMKKLFVFNKLWSLKEVFYNKDKLNEKITIKYKQLNFYTNSFQKPFLYPILEMNHYFPEFTTFKEKFKIFRNEEVKIIDYDFSINKNNNIEIKNTNEKFNKDSIQKCCLIKGSYHVKGYMSINEINSGAIINLIFKSINSTNDYEEICNLMKTENENTKFCHGSYFKCKEKDKNRIINIDSKHIKFIILRNYLYRMTAFEIFTLNNKSYLFNFHEDIAVEDNKKSFLNNLLKLDYFHEIYILKNNNKKQVIGYYNILINSYLNPFFANPINKNIEVKSRIFSNYDIIILLNLFANRSFNDLNQYPIFPTLYFLIKDEYVNNNNIQNVKESRMFDKPVGLQTFNEKCEKRTMFFEDLYNGTIEEGDEEQNLFTIFYSTSLFICGFLIRIFPYSLTAIELQGGGFDHPNRIFSNMHNALNNTLTQNSDLRELIPELFYMPDLFVNENKLELGKIEDEEVNNVYIYKEKDKDPINKYIFIKKMRSVLDNERKISNWIDLIFGKRQKYDKKNQKMYSINLEIGYKTDEIKSNDELIMKSTELGLLPFQLFNTEIPEIEIAENYQYPYLLFYENYKKTHIGNISLTFQSYTYKFDCTIKENYFNYLEGYKPKKNINDKNLSQIAHELLKNLQSVATSSLNNKLINKIFENGNREENFNDLFIIPRNNVFYLEGNVYGKIKLFPIEIIGTENKKEIKKGTSLIEFFDHTNEIKFIDYNYRLNIFISYGLDQIINIYLIPSFKLIRTIKLEYVINIDNYLDMVLLISNPFPMIFLSDSNFFYTLSINGEFIAKRKREFNNIKNIMPCIDNINGVFEDCVLEINDDFENNKNCIKYTFPELSKTKIILD